MKVSLFVLLVAGMHVALPVYAQVIPVKNEVTFIKNNASLQEIFNAIEKQTHYQFDLPYTAWVKNADRQNIVLKGVSPRAAMQICLREQPFISDIDDTARRIVIKVKEITGTVYDEKGELVEGVNISIIGTDRVTTTNANGQFIFIYPPYGDSLLFNAVNLETQTLKIPRSHVLTVIMKKKTQVLDFCTVTGNIHNGYQDTPRDIAGGAYSKPDKTLLKYPLTSNITYWMERLPGVQLTKNTVAGTNQPALTIRGLSTIHANAMPLIVIDNFPYEGDINNINPYDIENITVLKDAAAAGLWGTRAGNGVIVLTTKKGGINQPLKVELNIRTGIVLKPNPYNNRDFTDPARYIEAEKYWFANGDYDNILNDPSHAAVSPVIETLYRARAGIISSSSANAAIELMKANDTRSDLDRYIYRKAVNQGHAITLSGGGSKHSYYLQAGYDRDPGNLVANDHDRKTLSARNTFLLKKRLELSTGIMLFETSTKDNNDGSLGIKYPYTRLVDGAGNPLAITAGLREGYTDTAGQGKLLDWKYSPLEELRLTNNTVTNREKYLSANLRYTITQNLYFNIAYQYGEGRLFRSNLYNAQSYYVRNLVNQYTRLGAETIRPIPPGAIRDEGFYFYKTTTPRIQAGYNDTLGRGQHMFSVFAGAEQPTLRTETGSNRTYGINENGQGDNQIDFQSFFPMFYNPLSFRQVENPAAHASTVTNVISFYSNCMYSFKERYFLSFSARSDASNLYGIKTNRKAVPLWSASAAWNILKGDASGEKNLPNLRLRLSYGYNGNFSSAISPLTTIAPGGVNSYGAVTSSIDNPSNPSLKWEKVRSMNLGIDCFNTEKTIECSMDGYIKKGLDLIGKSSIDPTTGVDNFTGNSAAMTSYGIDASLRAMFNLSAVKWNASLVFNYANNKITHYGEEELPIWQYMNLALDKPLAGYPRYSLLSFKWRGLDPATGDPQGELLGQASTNYAAITASADRKQLAYSGSTIPRFFGSFCHTFSWQRWQLSFNINYKFGYYFRRTSVDYDAIRSGTSMGHADYQQRWQVPGDEKRTNIPSMPAQTDPLRDIFYTYSEALATKADHIRLQDIRFGYDVDREQLKKLPFEHFQVYLSGYNIGILWRANRYGIDPDYLLTIPLPTILTAGVKITL